MQNTSLFYIFQHSLYLVSSPSQQSLSRSHRILALICSHLYSPRIHNSCCSWQTISPPANSAEDKWSYPNSYQVKYRFTLFCRNTHRFSLFIAGSMERVKAFAILNCDLKANVQEACPGMDKMAGQALKRRVW